eukprot:TRINITY_DN76039_c0_g1_i1.p1 TRINITY_DN76039_c0_g1~~TRINITY_DN76039_c0_g1_i1.p1  ORF type:complete len:1048 (-),score=115.20 TRINITY_DN76039_c0_g1_i1:188-3025(-)
MPSTGPSRHDHTEVGVPMGSIAASITLRVSCFEVLRGKLVLVVGPVGAGKSTLIQGLLNEVPLVDGHVEIHGSVALCSQKPWVMNATVRDNILFGNELDPEHLAGVIRACALEEDLKQFPNHVSTVVGARGVNLSGGQRARISLARAAYASASLALLDDPLAAVDPHVSAHIVESCLGTAHGVMRRSTSILVTHQQQLVSQADLVVVVHDGRVVATQPPSSFTVADLQQFGLHTSSSLESPEAKSQQPPCLERQKSSLILDMTTTEPNLHHGLSAFEQQTAPPALSLVRVSSGPPVLSRSVSEPRDYGHCAPALPELVRARSAPPESATASSACVPIDDLLQKLSSNCVDADSQFEFAEDRQIGQVSLTIWSTYAKTMGCRASLLIVFLYVAANLMRLGAMFWIASWSASSAGDPLSCLLVYAALSFGTVVLMTIRSLVFRRTSLHVSWSLHDKALWSVMRAPKWWLESTATGRIVNRFSQDMARLDTELQNMIDTFCDSVLKMLFSVGLVVILIPALLIMSLPLGCLYFRVQSKFRKSSRELRRISALTRSPIFQNLNEAVSGLTTIRAYGKVGDFTSKNLRLCSRNIAADFINSGCGRWMGMRLRFVGMAFVAAVASFVVLQNHISLLKRIGGALSSALVGLALKYALELTGNMEAMIQSLTMTEQGLIALERIEAYTHLESECSLVLPGDDAVISQPWPTTGSIVFENVQLRYREGSPLVLKGVSFSISGGTAVGIVGRTGSGKSTTLIALFRLCKLDAGTICIDGVDIGRIGLHTLRRRVAIVPQEAIGFTGSLRFNLDPFGERSDTEIWAVLEKVQLKELVQTHGLDYHLIEGGQNLAAGERQLLCAARALLQNSRILVLDEATANVDHRTDALIQEVLRHEISTKKLTTLTIAHRINTILETDTVLVMDHGQVSETGPTRRLAEDPKSLFYSFVHPDRQ